MMRALGRCAKRAHGLFALAMVTAFALDPLLAQAQDNPAPAATPAPAPTTTAVPAEAEQAPANSFFTREELEGVLAHELSHVGNYDIRFMGVVVVLVAIVAVLSDFFLRFMWFGGDNEREDNQLFLILGIVGAILAPLAAISATSALHSRAGTNATSRCSRSSRDEGRSAAGPIDRRARARGAAGRADARRPPFDRRGHSRARDAQCRGSLNLSGVGSTEPPKSRGAGSAGAGAGSGPTCSSVYR